MNLVKHAYYEHDELSDGTKIVIRSVGADDKETLQGIVSRAGAESRYHRFFCAKKVLTNQELAYFTEIDFVNHVGLIACFQQESGQQPVAVTRYIALPDSQQSAEVALLVEDAYQRLGVGSLLIKHLAGLAIENGIEEFRFEVLAENAKMQNFLRHSPYALHHSQVNTNYKASLKLLDASILTDSDTSTRNRLKAS